MCKDAWKIANGGKHILQLPYSNCEYVLEVAIVIGAFIYGESESFTTQWNNYLVDDMIILNNCFDKLAQFVSINFKLQLFVWNPAHNNFVYFCNASWKNGRENLEIPYRLINY